LLEQYLWACHVDFISANFFGLFHHAFFGFFFGHTQSSSPTAKPGQDNSIVQQFLHYANVTPAQRMFADLLNKLGIAEDQFKAMSRADQQKVEEKVQWMIKQQVQNKQRQAHRHAHRHLGLIPASGLALRRFAYTQSGPNRRSSPARLTPN
jgi:hypothetical protein